MSSCQNCGSDRVISVASKCEDRCEIELLSNGFTQDDYVPDDMGIGGGDYLEFDLCLDCGLVQGDWPLPETEFEAQAAEESEDPEEEDNEEDDMDDDEDDEYEA